MRRILDMLSTFTFENHLKASLASAAEPDNTTQGLPKRIIKRTLGYTQHDTSHVTREFAFEMKLENSRHRSQSLRMKSSFTFPILFKSVHGRPYRHGAYL